MMSRIKREVAAFIADHQNNHFVMTPVTMREVSLRTAQEQMLPKVEMEDIVDGVLDGCPAYPVPVRVYIPHTSRPLPVLIYYHGGGFVIDTVSVYDPVCRRIAKATDHIVISPEYRLAPENPYPAAYDDALAVARHSLSFLEAKGIAHEKDMTLCGDSAGGCLAAVVSQTLQHDTDFPLSHQILIYPLLDFTGSFPSCQENCCDETGFSAEKMKWYFDQFFRGRDEKRAASPLFGELTPSMPATFVITTSFCPFHDEGVDYIRRLREVGIRAETYNYDNMVHSYLNFEKLCFEEIDDTYKRMAKFLHD